MTKKPIPWEELTDKEKRGFADMLNRRFNAEVTVSDAGEYYGNPKKIEREFGEESTSGGPECPECFTPLYKQDIPHLKRTGECPNCGSELVT